MMQQQGKYPQQQQKQQERYTQPYGGSIFEDLMGSSPPTDESQAYFTEMMKVKKGYQNDEESKFDEDVMMSDETQDEDLLTRRARILEKALNEELNDNATP
jgi:hypothetical protein